MGDVISVELTLEQRVRKKGIDLARKRLLEAKEEMRGITRPLLKACVDEGHVVTGRILWTEDDGRIVYGSAFCAVCGQKFGWYCPVGPLKYCEYPEYPNYKPYCIHCGGGTERK